MRHEVIKLAYEAIYPELIKLLESKGEPFYSKKKPDFHFPFLAFDNDKWQLTLNYTPTITDFDFLQKYGNTDQPDKEPKRGDLVEVRDGDTQDWRKAIFLAEVPQIVHPIICVMKSMEDEFRNGKEINVVRWKFMRPIPAFSLTCQDGVVHDEFANVWYLVENEIAKTDARWAKANGYDCFTSEQSALTHRHQNTPAIKLSDMEFVNGNGYWIAKEKAENLVNERINGK